MDFIKNVFTASPRLENRIFDNEPAFQQKSQSLSISSLHTEKSLLLSTDLNNGNMRLFALQLNKYILTLNAPYSTLASRHIWPIKMKNNM